MRSTRNLKWFLGMAFMSVFSGCQRTVPPPLVAPVNTTPLVLDDAIQGRQWDRSTSYYANGSTIDGGTGYLWQVHETMKPTDRRWAEVPVAVANMIAFPVGVFIEKPWEPQIDSGENVPPSYTAQPPLP